MRTLLFVFLLPFLAHADDRTFNEGDMTKLSGQIGKSLRKCKELKHGGTTEIAFSNQTSESIDKDAFSKAIQDQLSPTASGVPGRKYELEVKLASSEKVSAGNYENSYTLRADLKQGNELLCTKSEKLVKKGRTGK